MISAMSCPMISCSQQQAENAAHRTVQLSSDSRRRLKPTLVLLCIAASKYFGSSLWDSLINVCVTWGAVFLLFTWTNSFEACNWVTQRAAGVMNSYGCYVQDSRQAGWWFNLALCFLLTMHRVVCTMCTEGLAVRTRWYYEMTSKKTPKNILCWLCFVDRFKSARIFAKLFCRYKERI